MSTVPVAWLVKILKPPVVDPAGIVTLLGHVTNALLHVTGSVKSDDGSVATVTVPKELLNAVVGFGLGVSDAGGYCGASVSCDWTVVPFNLAPMVTVVFTVTAPVGIPTEME